MDRMNPGENDFFGFETADFKRGLEPGEGVQISQGKISVPCPKGRFADFVLEVSGRKEWRIDLIPGYKEEIRCFFISSAKQRVKCAIPPLYFSKDGPMRVVLLDIIKDYPLGV